MRLAILGTRGVPNFHGGFEQFAEYFSVYMADKGHEVYVYNSHNHPYKENNFKGVNIIHCYDPEYKVGTFGQFIYDLNCIRDSRKRSFDTILQLGYTSSSVWGILLPSKSQIVTNMDGLEWKRTKYSIYVRKFLKYAEKLGVKTSDVLVADSVGIQKHLKDTYGKESVYIPYGADIFDSPDEEVLKEYGLDKYGYNMLLARLEPENNIEVILDAVREDLNKNTFLVIGKHETTFGNYLKVKYEEVNHIRFLGGIYNTAHLNNLRHYSNLYFHGHSVGGTNPSLLEAMASSSFIIAHDNIFNRSILGEEAFYFKNEAQIVENLNLKKENYTHWIDANKRKITKYYDWEIINGQYQSLLEEVTSGPARGITK